MTQASQTPWERIPTLADEMAALLLDGNSAAQTAEILSRCHSIRLTRNAVIGKATRLNLRFSNGRGGNNRPRTKRARGGDTSQYTTRLKIERRHITFLRKIAIAKKPAAAALVAFEAQYGVRYSLSWLRALARKHNITFPAGNGLWRPGGATKAEKQTAAKLSNRAIARGRDRATEQTGPEPAAVEPHKSLLDLAHNECRWPHGEATDADFHFCAQPTGVGRPYCRHHMARAYTVYGGAG